jgi:hypothetical protein
MPFYLADETANPQDMALHFANYEVMRRGNPAAAARYRIANDRDITLARRALGLRSPNSERESEQPTAKPSVPRRVGTYDGPERCHVCAADVIPAIVLDSDMGVAHRCPICQVPIGTA